jgi:hypothetical protein
MIHVTTKRKHCVNNWKNSSSEEVVEYEKIHCMIATTKNDKQTYTQNSMELLKVAWDKS